MGRIGIMNEWVNLVALEAAQDSGAIGTTQQERSSTVGALTLYPMDDHDDRPGRKSETYPGVASVSGCVPYSAAA